MKWLNSFCISNEIAIRKLIDNFVTDHFDVKDNVIDKSLYYILSKYGFINKEYLNEFVESIEEVVQEFFTGNDKKKAIKLLNKKKVQYRRIDIALMGIFGGSSIVLMFLMGLLLLL